MTLQEAIKVTNIIDAVGDPYVMKDAISAANQEFPEFLWVFSDGCTLVTLRVDSKEPK